MTSAYLKVGAVTPAAGTNAPYLSDFVKPDIINQANLIGLYVFSGSRTRSLINHVNPALPLLPTGVPLYEPDGVVLSRGNFLDTQLIPTSAMTVVVLFEDAGNLFVNGGSLVSSLHTAALAGTAFSRGEDISISSNNDGVVRFFCDRGGAINILGVSTAMTMPNDGSHACVAVTINADNLADGVIGKAGVNQFIPQRADTGTGSRTIYNRTLRIGSVYDTAATAPQGSGKMRIKAVAIYNNANNSNALLADIIASLRSFATTVGLTF